MIVRLIIFFLIAYLIGSINFAMIICNLKNINIKEVGSGNAGATNTTRALGKKYGVLVFLLDFFKGLLSVAIPKICGFNDYLAIIGFFSVFGHTFPLYYGFKGGKGVSTTFGVLAALNIYSALFLGVIELLLIKATKIVSISTLITFILLPLSLLVFNNSGSNFNVYFSVVYTFLILFSHRSNIKKLINGTENSFKK